LNSLHIYLIAAGALEHAARRHRNYRIKAVYLPERDNNASTCEAARRLFGMNSRAAFIEEI